jgi:uncharacterized protein DUF6879
MESDHMSRWISSTKRGEWGQLHRSYRSSSFRLEAQQIYSNAAEDAWLTEFLAGRPLEGVDSTPRLTRWRDQKAAGRTKTTVRVVVEPQTDYTRMELATYRPIVAAGEDVRVIVVPEGGSWPDRLPLYDFFIFDERDVWRMHYNDDDTFAGAEQLDGEDLLAQHLRWRDRALELAIPLLEYPGVAQLPT